MNTAVQLSRRRFLAASGHLTVGFSLTATLNGLAAAASTPDGRLAVDSWLEISGGNDTLVTIYAGKVELGTGVRTALTQIVAEELSVTFQQVAYVQGDTDRTPGSQGYTAGSKTIQNEGPSLRLAAATAFQGLLGLAAAQFGVAASQLRAKHGRIGVGEHLRGSKTYGQLVGSLTYQMTSSTAVPVKPTSEYSIVGKSVKRVDLPGRFTAKTGFLSEFKLPGMLHARVVRPAGRNAAFVGFDAASLASVQSTPGVVQVVRQDVDAQRTDVTDHRPGLRRACGAERDVRGIERHRRHGLAGEAIRSDAVAGGDHRDSGAEPTQYVAHRRRCGRRASRHRHNPPPLRWQAAMGCPGQW